MCYGEVKEERVSREPVVTQREGPHQATIKTLWSWTLQLRNDKKKVSVVSSSLQYYETAVQADLHCASYTLTKVLYISDNDCVFLVYIRL